jgi:Cu/Ag efflux protein CusF
VGSADVSPDSEADPNLNLSHFEQFSTSIQSIMGRQCTLRQQHPLDPRGIASLGFRSIQSKEQSIVRKTLLPILTTVAILSFGLLVLAAQEPKEEPKQGSEGGAPEVVDATILQVDATTNSVTVQTTDQRKGALTVDSQTKITVNGKKAKLSDLKEGQQAKIAFNKQGKALSIDA